MRTAITLEPDASDVRLAMPSRKALASRKQNLYFGQNCIGFRVT